MDTLNHQLALVIAHLTVALTQVVDTDDEIIVTHMEDALKAAQTAMVQVDTMQVRDQLAEMNECESQVSA